MTYVISDLLSPDGDYLVRAAYSERRSRLEALELSGVHWQALQPGGAHRKIRRDGGVIQGEGPPPWGDSTVTLAACVLPGTGASPLATLADRTCKRASDALDSNLRQDLAQTSCCRSYGFDELRGFDF